MAGLALPNAAASRRVANPAAVSTAFAAHKPRHVVHLAAQAGVRWSIEHPFAYADSTLTGFLSVLEACRHQEVEHFLYACSSSVYDGDAKLPYATADSVDHPVSLYAATKKAGALMAHAYAHLYGLPATRLRFFTVCGPWGRPDMACWKFAEAILEGRLIDVHSRGDMARDPPYVANVVEPLARTIPRPPAPDAAFDRGYPDPARSWARRLTRWSGRSVGPGSGGCRRCRMATSRRYGRRRGPCRRDRLATADHPRRGRDPLRGQAAGMARKKRRLTRPRLMGQAS